MKVLWLKWKEEGDRGCGVREIQGFGTLRLLETFTTLRKVFFFERRKYHQHVFHVDMVVPTRDHTLSTKSKFFTAFSSTNPKTFGIPHGYYAIFCTTETVIGATPKYL